MAGACYGCAFTLPGAFIPLLEELCKRANECVAGPGIEVVPEVPEGDERRQRPSAGVDACIKTGVCVGLAQVRERPVFAADKVGASSAASAECNKQFPSGGSRTGGVMTVFCGHGICYAAFILAGAEGRDHLFSFMLKYLQEPPKFLIYDFGCAALDYCLNRLPAWFKNMTC